MAERNVLLKNVKHPFLVGLHYSFQTTEKLYFVLDFINGGEVSFIISFLVLIMFRKKIEFKFLLSVLEAKPSINSYLLSSSSI